MSAEILLNSYSRIRSFHTDTHNIRLLKWDLSHFIPSLGINVCCPSCGGALFISSIFLSYIIYPSGSFSGCPSSTLGTRRFLYSPPDLTYSISVKLHHLYVCVYRSSLFARLGLELLSALSRARFSFLPSVLSPSSNIIVLWSAVASVHAV